MPTEQSRDPDARTARPRPRPAGRRPDRRRRAVRRGPVRNPVPRGPRRRRHQDRGPVGRRRRQPLHPARSRRHRQPVLRGVQPRQAEPRAGSQDDRPAAPSSSAWSPTADAVFSNLRGDQAERLGLTYDVARPINPAIVCVALTGYGRDGPRRPAPRVRRADPGRGGLGLADRRAGRPAHQERPVAGRLHLRTDRGARARGRPASMRGGPAAAATSTPTSTTRRWRCSAIRRPGSCRAASSPSGNEMSAHPSVVPVPVLCHGRRAHRGGQPEGEVLPRARRRDGPPGRSADDARSPTSRAAAGTATELLAILSARFAERTTADWLERLRGRVPIAPVRSLEEALDVDELRDRVDAGRVRASRLWHRPLRRPAVDDERVRTRLHVPGRARPGRRRDPRGAGFRGREVALLRASGAFGATSDTGRSDSIEPA